MGSEYAWGSPLRHYGAILRFQPWGVPGHVSRPNQQSALHSMAPLSAPELHFIGVVTPVVTFHSELPGHWLCDCPGFFLAEKPQAYGEF